eukprot:277755-Chlamydomonas_euryale.AAC.1
MAATRSRTESRALTACRKRMGNSHACRSRPSVAGRRRLRTACLLCCTVRSSAAYRTACATPWAGGPKA